MESSWGIISLKLLKLHGGPHVCLSAPHYWAMNSTSLFFLISASYVSLEPLVWCNWNFAFLLFGISPHSLKISRKSKTPTGRLQLIWHGMIHIYALWSACLITLVCCSCRINFMEPNRIQRGAIDHWGDAACENRSMQKLPDLLYIVELILQDQRLHLHFFSSCNYNP